MQPIEKRETKIQHNDARIEPPCGIVAIPSHAVYDSKEIKEKLGDDVGLINIGKCASEDKYTDWHKHQPYKPIVHQQFGKSMPIEVLDVCHSV